MALNSRCTVSGLVLHAPWLAYSCRCGFLAARTALSQLNKCPLSSEPANKRHAYSMSTCRGI